MTHGGILIAGPTASGKSRLALAIAKKLEPIIGVTIINSDSMQVYRDLRILTARPLPEEEKITPHRLYGIFSSDQRCSAGRWSELARHAISDVHAEGRIPIVVGGTGLYFQALVEGLASVPEISKAVRERAVAHLNDRGAVMFHKELADMDPIMANRIRSTDRQRMLRAWEVLEGTGISLADWQTQKNQYMPLPGRFARIVLLPDREFLYGRCDTRFQEMVANGALDEVSVLTSKNISVSHPLMKALGVRELAAYLEGNTDLEAAIVAGQRATRRYAKRQMTWLRNRMIGWTQFRTQDMESFFPEIFSFIRQFVLTL